MNHARLLIDGHRILPALLEDIAAARRSIHVAMFLFFRDPIGQEIAEALASKVAQGVEVRVLLNLEKTQMGDPFSTGEKRMMKHDPNVHHDPTDVGPLCAYMKKQGIQVVDTNIDYDRVIQARDPRLRSLGAQIRETIAVDDLHVDHRKIVVIDGRVAYCGGANVGAQYLYHRPFDPEIDARVEGDEHKKRGMPEPWWKWHDSLTRFEGPVARELEGHFRDRWILDGGEEYEPAEPLPPEPRGRPIGKTEVLLNEPNDQPNHVRERYLELIGEARESIFIENPYLYHPAIVDALVAAKRARPSLRVDLVMPARRHNDNSFAHDAQQHSYARFIQVGIAVYEYQNHFNHLKIAAFDGRISIHGSTNLNCRSLENDKDFELVVCVEDEGLAGQVLTEVRDVDVRYSKRFTRRDLRGLRGRFRVRTRDPRTLLLLARRML
ncbi:MAG TPA: phosphatidylserine/phosphatidylglycerophosphate/cardiolipin synthase family protein [Myxococcales bacterium]|nr:phosphatidylserine/phosphatidylglycerophosphate/cardiolipin synthase family protein [Myxococcales bacterium]